MVVPPYPSIISFPSQKYAVLVPYQDPPRSLSSGLLTGPPQVYSASSSVVRRPGHKQGNIRRSASLLSVSFFLVLNFIIIFIFGADKILHRALQKASGMLESDGDVASLRQREPGPPARL
jgi:hypothetical protein